MLSQHGGDSYVSLPDQALVLMGPLAVGGRAVAPLEGPGGAEDGPESFLEEGVQGPSPADRNRRRGRPRGESLGGGVQVMPQALGPHEVSLRGGTGAGAGGSRCRALGGVLAEPTGKELPVHTEQTASGRGACSLPGAGAPERLAVSSRKAGREVTRSALAGLRG